MIKAKLVFSKLSAAQLEELIRKMAQEESAEERKKYTFCY